MRWIALVLVSMLLARPAPAGFGDGLAAYDAGDYETALAEWRPLAEGGDVTAQTMLAGMYLDGRGVARDPVAAARWYRRAAEQGDMVAQLNLGDLYARGVGVPRDRVSAYAWLGLAAAQGNRWAASRRTEIAERMSKDEIARAEERMRDLRRRRSEE